MSRIYNKVFDPQVWEQVNPRNKELLGDFVMDLKENRRSAGTIRQYEYNLRNLFCYTYRTFENRFILELNRKELKRYALALVDEFHLSNARRNGLISSLQSMLTYAEMDDDWNYEINAGRLIKSLGKEPVKPIVFLEDATVVSLFDSLTKKGELQKACLLMLAYDSAGRRNELAQVTKDSFLEPARNNTNVVVGKGRNKFSLLYFDKTRRAALAWLEQRGSDDIPTLFVEDNNGPKRAAETHDIYEMFCPMREFLDLRGAEIDFGPHSMRHSALQNYKNGSHHVCRALGKAGFSLEQLQYLAHHESSQTTQSYLTDPTNSELEGMFGIQIQ